MSNNDRNATGIRVKSLKLNDDSSVSMEKTTILVLTGPNNCGKSQILRDIAYNYFSETRKSVVVKELDCEFIGSLDGLKVEFSSEDEDLFEGSRGAWFRKQNDLFDRPFELLTAAFSEASYLTSSVIKYFLTFMNTASRLIAFNDTITSHIYMGYMEKHYMEKLPLKDVYENAEIENKVYSLIEDSFGKGVLLNRVSYNKPNLHYVRREDVNRRPDKGLPSFSRWFEKQPSLDQQGDGIISFCNILINLLISQCPLILLDEPEAFLHAPQIRSLARIIAQETSAETQIILSTHSHDLVQGLIDFGSDRVDVARISRKYKEAEEINQIRRLNSSDIADLWQDPLLRTSDVLTSLFHHVAIIVEGDSDARFLRAMMEAVSSQSLNKTINIRFFHCNGKDRIPKIASALHAIGIPVMCVVDIDVLDDRAKFLQFVRSFGGNDEDFDADLKNVIRFVSEHRAVGTSAEAKESIDAVFSMLDPKTPIPKEAITKIFEAARTSSAWSLVKRSGESFFTRGEPYNNFNRIAARAREIGILINKSGELENLCKDVESRKSEWLNAVLQRDLRRDPNLKEARAFAEQIYALCLQVANISSEPTSSDQALAVDAARHGG